MPEALACWLSNCVGRAKYRRECRGGGARGSPVVEALDQVAEGSDGGLRKRTDEADTAVAIASGDAGGTAYAWSKRVQSPARRRGWAGPGIPRSLPRASMIPPILAAAYCPWNTAPRPVAAPRTLTASMENSRNAPCAPVGSPDAICHRKLPASSARRCHDPSGCAPGSSGWPRGNPPPTPSAVAYPSHPCSAFCRVSDSMSRFGSSPAARTAKPKLLSGPGRSGSAGGEERRMRLLTDRRGPGGQGSGGVRRGPRAVAAVRVQLDDVKPGEEGEVDRESDRDRPGVDLPPFLKQGGSGLGRSVGA